MDHENGQNCHIRFNINVNYTRSLAARRGIRQGDPTSPLLFVLMMEYITRMLLQLDKIPNFNYHSKCEKMKLTSLTFTNEPKQMFHSFWRGG